MTTDNMGGYISADFILHQEVKSFIPAGEKCFVVPLENCNWRPIEIQYQGININPGTENLQTRSIHQFTGTITIKKNCTSIPILRHNPYIILRLQSPDGEYQVIGTQEYPLTTTVSRLIPGKPANFTGWQLTIEGKQTHPSHILAT